MRGVFGDLVVRTSTAVPTQTLFHLPVQYFFSRLLFHPLFLGRGSPNTALTIGLNLPHTISTRRWDEVPVGRPCFPDLYALLEGTHGHRTDVGVAARKCSTLRQSNVSLNKIARYPIFLSACI